MNLRLRIFALVLTLIGLAQCEQKKTDRINEKKILFNKEGNLSVTSDEGLSFAQFDIEIADSPYERQTGLMYRDVLRSKNGMFFVFEKSEMRSFYMKNTLIPLDLIFIDAELNITHIHSNAKPNEIQSISSKFPAKYVLEINAGLTQKLHIINGMKINFNRL